VVDIGVKEVKQYYVSPKPSKEVDELLSRYGMTVEDLNPSVFMVSEDSEVFDPELKEGKSSDHSTVLAENLEEGQELPAYFYEIEFEKPGGIVMPIIVEYSYADGSTERVKYPVQVWRKNDASVRKLLTSEKELIGVTVDPDAETADVNLTNNAWPKKEADTDFDKFKSKVQG